MLCYIFACRLEDEIKEAGIAPPERKTFFDNFPPYRLKRNIDAINHYVGMDVSEHILREHVVNTFRRDIRLGLDRISEVLDNVRSAVNARRGDVLVSINVTAYIFRESFRESFRKSAGLFLRGQKRSAEEEGSRRQGRKRMRAC